MKRILIIEDDEKLRCELETFLNKNGFVTYIIITPNIPKGINVSKHIRPLILNFLLL